MAAKTLVVTDGTSPNTYDPKGGYKRKQTFMTMNRIFDSMDTSNME